MVINESALFRSASKLATSVDASPKAYVAEVVLGVSSRRCRGNGICSMFARGHLGMTKRYCNYALAEIEKDPKENLVFKLRIDSMRNSTIQKYFTGSQFLMEETFQIPEFVRESLNINRLEILQGVYPSYTFDAFRYIIFPNTLNTRDSLQS